MGDLPFSEEKGGGMDGGNWGRDWEDKREGGKNVTGLKKFK